MLNTVFKFVSAHFRVINRSYFSIKDKVNHEFKGFLVINLYFHSRRINSIAFSPNNTNINNNDSKHFGCQKFNCNMSKPMQLHIKPIKCSLPTFPTYFLFFPSSLIFPQQQTDLIIYPSIHLHKQPLPIPVCTCPLSPPIPQIHTTHYHHSCNQVCAPPIPKPLHPPHTP